MIMPTKRSIDEDVYFCGATGPGIDVDKAIADQEYFLSHIKKMTRISDLQFGDVKTLYSYR